MIQIAFLLVFVVSIVSAEPKCGIKSVNYSSQDRILGGRNALPNEWPWQVSMQSKSLGPHNCGGTLINSQWVLCAAHCAFNAAEYTIILGKHNLKLKEDTQREFNISKAFVHEKFDKPAGSLQNDVSLLKLDKPVDFEVDKHLVPLCLAKSGLNVENMTCFTTGWGATSMTTEPDILQVGDGKIVSNSLCQQENGSIRPIVDGMICAGGDKEGRGACYGDSGGPLQCKINDVWTQVGIVSWGKPCAHAGHADVYTRVSHYIDWIQDKINNN